MGLKQEYLRRAVQMITDRKAEEQKIADHKREKLFRLSPDYAAVEKEIQSNGLAAAKQALTLQDSLKALSAYHQKHLELLARRDRILSECGLTTADLEPRISCKLCKDSGYKDGSLCSCVKKIAKKFALDDLNAASPLSLTGFENFRLDYYPDVPNQNGIVPRERMLELLNFCESYAAQFSLTSSSLLFIGETGLGKTHLSLAIAQEVIQKGFGVLYGSAQDYLHRIESDHFGKTQDNMLDALIDCDLLVLDDLGAEFSSAFSISAIYNIVNSRILVKRPTIINTNYSLHDLEKHYTRRVISRFVGYYHIKQFFGRDIRYIKAKNSSH